MTHKLITAARAFIILSFVLLGSLLVYTFLHESGHALAALSLGGAVTDFNLNFLNLSAHVSLIGTFTPTQTAWINLSGVALPFVVWLLVMLALPKQAAPLVQIAKGLTSLIVVNTLLAWMVLPILHFIRCAPPSDDVTRFLVNSQVAPLAVALTTTVLYAFGWHITTRQVGQFHTALGTVLKMDVPPLPGRPIAVLVAVSAVVVMLGGMSVSGCLEQRRIPDGFTLVKDVDLSAQAATPTPLISFTLTQPERVSFLLRVQNLNAAYLDVTLQKVDGDPVTLLHGEGFSTSDNMSELDLMLGTGDYQILLTTKEATGTLQLYLERP